MSETTAPDGDGFRLSRRAKLGAAVATAGIIGSGLLDFLFAQVGQPGLGALAWLIGFSTTVVLLWYLLLRPLDIGGP